MRAAASKRDKDSDTRVTRSRRRGERIGDLRYTVYLLLLSVEKSNVVCVCVWMCVSFATTVSTRNTFFHFFFSNTAVCLCACVCIYIYVCGARLCIARFQLGQSGLV